MLLRTPEDASQFHASNMRRVGYTLSSRTHIICCIIPPVSPLDRSITDFRLRVDVVGSGRLSDLSHVAILPMSGHELQIVQEGVSNKPSALSCLTLHAARHDPLMDPAFGGARKATYQLREIAKVALSGHAQSIRLGRTPT